MVQTLYDQMNTLGIEEPTIPPLKEEEIAPIPQLPSTRPLEIEAQQDTLEGSDILFGEEGEDVLIGSGGDKDRLEGGTQPLDPDNKWDAIFKETLVEPSGYVEVPPTTVTEDIANMATDTGDYLLTAGKMGLYGTLRQGVIGTGEFILSTPIWGAKLLSGTTRAIEEGAKAALRIMPDSWEYAISRFYGVTDRNILDYVDIFDTQTEIDQWTDQYIFSTLNSGIDYITDGNVDNYFSVIDASGNRIKGDYSDFMDTVFEDLMVPQDKQNYLGRVLMTAGEFVIPLGAMRTAAGKVGESAVDIAKKYGKARTDRIKRIGELQDKRGLPKKVGPMQYDKKTIIEHRRPVEMTKYERKLRDEVVALDKKIKDLAFKQRHYSVGKAGANVGKKTRDSSVVTVKDFMKSEGNMAVGAATAMVTTEYLLEEMGLEEWKPAALFVGLVGGVAGISGQVNALSKSKHLAMYGLKVVLEGVDPQTQLKNGAMNSLLRFQGFSNKQINKMSNEEKIRVSSADPKLLKMARQTGQALVALKQTNPEVYAQIEKSIIQNNEVVERFNRDIARDVEEGLIKRNDANYVSETLPVLLDQIVQLSSLSKIRETLLQNASVGGITLNIKKLITVNELDEMSRTIETQNKHLQNSLKGIAKRIKKKSGDAASPVQRYVSVMQEFTKDYGRMAETYKQRIDDIRKVKEIEVHPVNNSDLQKNMDTMLGEDTLTAAAMAERARQRKSLQPDFDGQVDAGANLKKYGDDQVDMLSDSFTRLKKKVDDAYLEVEDYDMDADFLFRDNDNIDMLLEGSDALKIFQTERVPIEARLERLIRAARKQGLRSYRGQNFPAEMTEAQQLEHFNDLYAMTIKQDLAIGKKYTDATDEKIATYREMMDKRYEANGYERTIAEMEKELIASDIFKNERRGTTSLISHEVKAVDELGETITKETSIIPLNLSFKDINDIRGRTMSRAYERNRTTGDLTKNRAQRLEAQTFISLVDDRIATAERQLRNSGVDINAYEKLTRANAIYANTLGKTFKKRLGSFFKKQADGEVTETVNNINNEDLFELFFKTDNHRDAAQQFNIMFSELDDLGRIVKREGDDNYERAKGLLRTSLRRHIQSPTGKVAGMKKIDDIMSDAFLTGEKGVHLFSKNKAEDVDEFFRWKNAENEYFDRKGNFSIPQKELQFRHNLERALESLSVERQDVLKNSIFGSSDKTKSIKEIVNEVFERDAAFHAGVEDLKYFYKRAEDTADSFTMADYDAMAKNREFIDSVEVRERYFDDADKFPLTAKPSDVIGAPTIRGAAYAKSPVEVLLDTFKGTKHEENVTLALQGIFVENIARNAYKFSKATRQLSDETDYVFELARDVELGEFGRLLAQNKEQIDILWKDSPDQLQRIKDVYNLEIMFKTKGVEGAKLLDTGIKFKASSLISRVYSISRGVISPKYVATEIAIAKAQAEKGNFMLKLLMDPDTTKTVEEGMRIAAGQMEAKPENINKLIRLAVTLFYTDMGHDYPLEVKDPSWYKEQLMFIPNLIEDISRASKRTELGITEEQDVGPRIRTPTNRSSFDVFQGL